MRSQINLISLNQFCLLCQLSLNIKSSMQESNQSIPLVRTDPNTHKFYLTSEAQYFLQSLPGPIAVITIAGLYRTGKSFLVNKLMPSMDYQTSHQGFKVGASTQSTTKGLNIWGSPIKIYCEETGEDIDYLLIDSEGLGSCDQSLQHDTDLLILIFLLSSTVVYNSIGAIDELGLEQLEVVLKLKNCVESKPLIYNESSDKSNFQTSYKVKSDNHPKFVWVLRDFALQLIDKEGNPITSNQYLEQCLQETTQNQNNPSTKRKNLIRKAIKQNLVDRSCYTLVRPTIKQEDLQKMTSVSAPVKLRTQFIQQIEFLKDDLFSGSVSDIKSFNGSKINGRLFCKILMEYLATINEGQLPNIGNVWDSVLATSNQQHYEQCVQKLKKSLRSLKLPFPKDELKTKINQIENKIYAELQANIKSRSDTHFKKYQKQFLKVVQALNNQLKERNQELRATHIVQQLRAFVKQNVSFEDVKVTNFAESMKKLTDKMKQKINGEKQGYEYLLNVLNDIVFVVQQKCIKMDREFNQNKLLLDEVAEQKKNQDLALINMKKEYHESLKMIGRLQESQADIDKVYILNQSKSMSLQKKVSELQAEIIRQRQKHQKQVRELTQKNRIRVEELTSEIKKLKEQNNSLNQCLDQSNDRLRAREMEQRKEVIFEQKIKTSFDKFSSERGEYLEEISGLRKRIAALQAQNSRLLQDYQLQCFKQTQLQQQNKKKEQNFHKQFQSLKDCIKNTKDSYQLTFQTIQNNEQVCKDIQNITSQKKGRVQHKQNQGEQKGNTDARSDKLMKNYYDHQLSRKSEEYELLSKRMEEKIRYLQAELDRQRENREIYQMDAQEYKQKCMKLQSDITAANVKFSSCLKQIQDARHNERALYEQSIVKLLENMEKKETRANRSERRSINLYQTSKRN